MKFLGNVLAVIVGLFVFSILSFLLLLGLIGIVASTGEKEVTVKENTILHLDLNGRTLVERTSDDKLSFGQFANPFGNPMTAGLVNLKKAIREAKTNEKVKGIYLNTGLIIAGQANLLELREELEAFKESGKFIIAYDEAYSEGGYYLASVADEIYLNPLGGIDFNGLASEVIFLKGFFEKVGIEPEVFRVGEFKSAVEPFILDKMSEANRLQTQYFLDDINDQMVQAVANSRSVALDSMTLINDLMLVRKPEDAVKYQLVNELLYEDQVHAKLREKLGLEEDEDIPSINATDLGSVAKSMNITSKNRIAVIIAEGEIVSGEADGVISSEKFAKEIRKARKDDDIKAIVLRVNSPGGSIVASEVIWREMSEAKKVKPVIVSMGEVAASGGYYISAPADTIVAQPNTITGSIGIFGLWFNVQELINDKLGITTDVVNTGQLSDFMNPGRDLTEVERSIIQSSIEDGYDTFIKRVAEGRGMSPNAVKEVASGRVWTGNQALERGLVDVLGGLDKAIEIAVAKIEAGDDYRVIYYPTIKPWFEQIMSDLGESVETKILQAQLGEHFGLYQKVNKLKHYQGIQVRMPQDIVIK
ncbi:MAG TPA: signal peptide peptidase SppA [Algoriphagus sp.]|jgi:protease-4|uniref:signal peptide peptidase SppA n=1 Tax=unclassified Algoriphagus TaxID=2641541 RepID=UPI000C48D483|nr:MULTISPECIES: signal peptide peptidase SppA [unclassified Algoriphagus]MAL15067.1 signal peptide peptidase SppA [Algoriphagus sp.]MAN87832.1 signal peptide peptidase SppA [Algoriphagus sp.]HAD51496.1 signal peptide peptidase SppA [Algoriphagus sp.]HAS59522.1 signal peptide peptidase SppA [Algoriphagus sp.]HCD89594.1 signal peptide peptidase SppA [Algoriphagus sp.]